MNKPVFTIFILMSLIFAGFVTGAAMKNRKQWKNSLFAAELVKDTSPVSGPANIGVEDLSGPLHQLPLNSRRWDAEKLPGDTAQAAGGQFDNYDETVVGEPAGRTWPHHLDDMFYYHSTPLPYYTLGPILGIGYHPEITEKHVCEEIYDDWAKGRHQLGAEDASVDSPESDEVVQMFAQVSEPSNPRPRPRS